MERSFNTSLVQLLTILNECYISYIKIFPLTKQSKNYEEIRKSQP